MIPKTYYCKICDYFARDSFNMNKHVNTRKHDQMCIVAQTTTENAVVITNNMQNNESNNDNNKYKCNVCGNKYAFRQSLWKHRQMHHQRESQIQTNDF
jgi:rubredoxin